MEEVPSETIEVEHHELTSFSGIEPKFDTQPRRTGHGSSFLSTLSVTSCVISYSGSAKRLLYVFLVITCVPLVVGAAFTSIFIEDGNYNAAVVSFFIACLSFGTASLFVLHLLTKLEKVHDNHTLEGLKVFAMILSVASGISLGVYTILAFFDKQDFNLHGTNFFSSAVFSGICLAASIQLYLTAQWYQNALKNSEGSSPINRSRSLNAASAAIN